MWSKFSFLLVVSESAYRLAALWQVIGPERVDGGQALGCRCWDRGTHLPFTEADSSAAFQPGVGAHPGKDTGPLRDRKLSSAGKWYGWFLEVVFSPERHCAPASAAPPHRGGGAPRRWGLPGSYRGRRLSWVIARAGPRGLFVCAAPSRAASAVSADWGCSSDLGWPPAQRSHAVAVPLRVRHCPCADMRLATARTRCMRRLWPSRSCWAASGVVGAAARTGTRARTGREGEVPSQLSGLYRVASLLCPRTNSFGERSPGGASGATARRRPPGGAWQAGPRPGWRAASGGLGGRLPLRVVPGAEDATAGRESCLDHYPNGSLQNVNNLSSVQVSTSQKPNKL